MRTLVDARRLESRISELAVDMEQHYRPFVSEVNPLLVLGVMDGCVLFLSDLVRRMNLPIELAFLTAKSYQGAVSGELTLDLGGLPELKGRHVLVLDDILDTGRTLSALRGIFLAREPSSLEMACLLRKQLPTAVDVMPRWVGFSIENFFVVGYGMDFQGRYRNLPEIAVLDGQ